MRIEIFSGNTILGLGTDLDRLQNEIGETIHSLRTVDCEINALSGGPQQLSGASSEIRERIRAEQAREQSVIAAKQNIGHFLESVHDTDCAVTRQVSGSTEKFFDQYSWLRPMVPEEKSWWERRVEDWNNFWSGVGEGLANAWEAIKGFYYAHKQIIDSIVIVVGAVTAVAAVIGSGGAALVPLMGWIGFSAGTAAGISTMVATVAVVSTVGAATLNLVDTWVEIDSPIFNTIQSGLNITSMITNLTYSAGMLFNAWNGVSAEEIATFKKMSYSSDEIKNAVRQDRILKVNYKKIGLMSDEAKGNYGEMAADKAMREQGYKRISDETVTSLKGGHQGIDGTYFNGKTYAVGEAKYHTAQLRTLPDGTKQMSRPWIESRLPLDVSEKTVNTVTINGDDLIDSLNDVKRFLIQVNKSGSNPGSICIPQLDDAAKVIHNIRPIQFDLKIPKISLGDFSANSAGLSDLFIWQTGTAAQ